MQPIVGRQFPGIYIYKQRGRISSARTRLLGPVTSSAMIIMDAAALEIIRRFLGQGCVVLWLVILKLSRILANTNCSMTGRYRGRWDGLKLPSYLPCL